MRNSHALRISLFALFSLVLFSCNKTEDLASGKLEEYMPLQPGKYITYRLDSMVFTNFGRTTEIHRYQMKHVVDAQLTDNMGRPSYRIYTYIRDSAGTEPWTAMGSYFITPLAKNVEVIDDNMRVIKLQLPITEGFQWKGNTYLADEPYYDVFDFNNDNDMQDWNFTYGPLEPVASYRGNDYDNVYTITQQDDHFNIPVVDPTSYGIKTLSVEKYAKNIGMVYRNYEMWEYQPNPSGVSPYNTGFGITLWMIEHN